MSSVIRRQLGEWGESCDPVKFSKALTLSAMTFFVDKLMRNELEKQLKWIESLAERFVVSSAECSWRPVTSLVPQGPVQGQYWHCFNNMAGREGHTFSKFADGTKYFCIACAENSVALFWVTLVILVAYAVFNMELIAGLISSFVRCTPVL